MKPLVVCHISPCGLPVTAFMRSRASGATVTSGATGVSPGRRTEHGQDARATRRPRVDTRPGLGPVARKRGFSLFVAVLAVLAAPAGSASLCPVARAASGTLHRGTGAGLKMEVDTRWPGGAGYRPVRITVTPIVPPIADRTLTVEVAARRFWNHGHDDHRVVQHIEIPAGSGPIATTLSVPQTLGWNRYKVTVVEDGQAIRGLSYGGAGDQYTAWVWEEKFPRLLIVGDTLPDTSGLAALLNVAEYNQYGAGVVGAGARAFLPTAHATPAAELPSRWIDYTNLDLVCLSLDQLAGLAKKRPEAFRAILDWTSAGGNVIVYGVGRDWRRLGELESLAGLAPGSDDTTRSPARRGWTEPDPKRFGGKLRGVGTNVSDPFAASPHGLPSAQFRGPGMGMVPGAGDGSDTDKVEDEEDLAPGQVEPTECLAFVLRPLQLGMVVAVADEDPFALSFRRSALGWGWLLNSLGSRRFLWYQRHGLSASRENKEFWNFLIPGVGLAPVMAFRVLITLFVLAIGPLNYVLLRRWKSLHLLVITVPLSAAAVTLALFAYALVADGLGTRVRARSFTHIDQRRGRAACWSRLSYYAGLSPSGGLAFPPDVAVIPYEAFPAERSSRTRELVWEESQWLRSGWLPSRTPTQFVTLRSRPTKLGLTIPASQDDAGVFRAENRLGTRIEQLVVRAPDGRFFQAADVERGAAVEAVPVQSEDAKRLLDRIHQRRAPKYPIGLDQRKQRGYSGWSPRRSSWQWMSSQADLPDASQQTGLLEFWLARARSLSLQPRSYAAIVERSPEVVVGTPAAREEAGFHVILGTW